MGNEQPQLPPGFSPWPPDPQAFVDDIKKKWDEEPGRHGRHCAVWVWGTNPLSGYMIVMKPVPPSE
jgi:hypothetical protein